MAICKSCGRKYKKFTTPVSARGVCRDCFFADLADDGGSVPAERPTPPPAPQEVVPEKRMVPIRFSSFLPRSRSKLVFVLVMSCYCTTFSSLIVVFTRLAQVPRPPRAFYLRGDPSDFVYVLFLGPLIESGMLVGVFELVRRVRTPAIVQVLTSALFICELHVWPWWPHGFIVLPSFCIQSASYLYWRRSSRKEAFWLLAAIHALNNLAPAISLASAAMRRA
jgi:hypothetical protein